MPQNTFSVIGNAPSGLPQDAHNSHPLHLAPGIGLGPHSGVPNGLALGPNMSFDGNYLNNSDPLLPSNWSRVLQSQPVRPSKKRKRYEIAVLHPSFNDLDILIHLLRCGVQ